jgi:hypothetical protein
MLSVGTKVPHHVKVALEREASAEGMSVSEYLRCQIRKLTHTEPRSLAELDDHPREDEARAAA